MYLAWSRTEVFVNDTRLRGMFATGGEVYRWFALHVTEPIRQEMRKEVAQHTRSGRLMRSLYSDTYGTNQYLLDIYAGSTAEHAKYFINETPGMIIANGSRGGTKGYMAVGGEYTWGIPAGGPKDPGPAPGIQFGVDSVRGYEGNNFIEDAVSGVLRRRRLT